MKTSTLSRTGRLGTIYAVERFVPDPNEIRNKKEIKFPFVSGSQYKGDWEENRKHGFGVQIETDGTKYEGEWVNDRREGRGTLWVKKGKKEVKQYTGEWYDNRIHGSGVYYYPNGDVYTGQWERGERCGQGRLDYADGNYYIGDWLNGMRCGEGAFYMQNGNIYEGHWVKDVKEGPGRFFYASTRKVYEGEWVKDQPECGEYRQPSEEELSKFNEPTVWDSSFELPLLELKNPRSVLDSSVAQTRAARAVDRGISSEMLDPEVVQRAEELFKRMDTKSSGTLPFLELVPVFRALGMAVVDNLESVCSQLGIQPEQLVSFPEVVDVFSFLRGLD